MKIVKILLLTLCSSLNLYTMEPKRETESEIQAKKAKVVHENVFLFDAISKGDHEEVKKILDLGTSVNVPIGKTSAVPARPLSDIWTTAPTAEFHRMLEGTAAEFDAAKYPPLYLAAKQGKDSVVALLLKRGANVDATTILGDTALHIAAYNGFESIVADLLNRGAHVNAVVVPSQFNGTKPLYACDGATPLFNAALGSHYGIALLLLKRSANIDAALKTKNDAGATPLYAAALKGHTSVAKLLLEQGANVNAAITSPGESYGATPLYIASEKGHTDIVQLLLDKNAKIEARSSVGDTYSGATPLFTASFHGHEKTVELLLNNGADVNAVVNEGPYRGATALWIALMSGRESIVRLLIGKGADVNATPFSPGSFTPLVASSFGQINANDVNYAISVISLLVTHGVIIPQEMKDKVQKTVKNSLYVTPLEYAAAFEPEELQRLFINNEQKYTPDLLASALMWAAARKQLDNVKLLIKNGAAQSRALERVTLILMQSKDTLNSDYAAVFDILLASIADDKQKKLELSKLLEKAKKHPLLAQLLLNHTIQILQSSVLMNKEISNNICIP